MNKNTQSQYIPRGYSMYVCLSLLNQELLVSISHSSFTGCGFKEQDGDLISSLHLR